MPVAKRKICRSSSTDGLVFNTSELNNPGVEIRLNNPVNFDHSYRFMDLSGDVFWTVGETELSGLIKRLKSKRFNTHYTEGEKSSSEKLKICSENGMGFCSGVGLVHSSCFMNTNTRNCITAGDIRNFLGAVKNIPPSLIILMNLGESEEREEVYGESIVDPKGVTGEKTSKGVTAQNNVAHNVFGLETRGCESKGEEDDAEEEFLRDDFVFANHKTTHNALDNSPTRRFLNLREGRHSMFEHDGDYCLSKDLNRKTKIMVVKTIRVLVKTSSFAEDADWEELNDLGIDVCREYVYQKGYKKRVSYQNLGNQWLMLREKPFDSSDNMLQAFAEFYDENEGFGGAHKELSPKSCRSEVSACENIEKVSSWDDDEEMQEIEDALELSRDLAQKEEIEMAIAASVGVEGVGEKNNLGEVPSDVIENHEKEPDELVDDTASSNILRSFFTKSCNVGSKKFPTKVTRDDELIGCVSSSKNINAIHNTVRSRTPTGKSVELLESSSVSLGELQLNEKIPIKRNSINSRATELTTPLDNLFGWTPSTGRGVTAKSTENLTVRKRRLSLGNTKSFTTDTLFTSSRVNGFRKRSSLHSCRATTTIPEYNIMENWENFPGKRNFGEMLDSKQPVDPLEKIRKNLELVQQGKHNSLEPLNYSYNYRCLPISTPHSPAPGQFKKLSSRAAYSEVYYDSESNKNSVFDPSEAQDLMQAGVGLQKLMHLHGLPGKVENEDSVLPKTKNLIHLEDSDGDTTPTKKHAGVTPIGGTPNASQEGSDEEDGVEQQVENEDGTQTLLSPPRRPNLRWQLSRMGVKVLERQLRLNPRVLTTPLDRNYLRGKNKVSSLKDMNLLTYVDPNTYTSMFMEFVRCSSETPALILLRRKKGRGGPTTACSQQQELCGFNFADFELDNIEKNVFGRNEIVIGAPLLDNRVRGRREIDGDRRYLIRDTHIEKHSDEEEEEEVSCEERQNDLFQTCTTQTLDNKEVDSEFVIDSRILNTITKYTQISALDIALSEQHSDIMLEILRTRKNLNLELFVTKSRYTCNLFDDALNMFLKRGFDHTRTFKEVYKWLQVCQAIQQYLIKNFKKKFVLVKCKVKTMICVEQRNNNNPNMGRRNALRQNYTALETIDTESERGTVIKKRSTMFPPITGVEKIPENGEAYPILNASAAFDNSSREELNSLLPEWFDRLLNCKRRMLHTDYAIDVFSSESQWLWKSECLRAFCSDWDAVLDQYIKARHCETRNCETRNEEGDHPENSSSSSSSRNLNCDFILNRIKVPSGFDCCSKLVDV